MSVSVNPPEVRDERQEREAATAPRRRPYVAPLIESGEAFERVQLASGCNEGVEDCEIPC